MIRMRSVPTRNLILLAAVPVAALLLTLISGVPSLHAGSEGRTAAPASPPPAGKAQAKDAAAREKVLAEIREFEERFNKAYEANDMKAYWDCFSDDMTQYWQEGRLDLAEYRTFWEKELAEGARMLEVRTADMLIHVDPSLDSAVVAYRIFTKMRRADGSIAESWNQETDVLFKTNGRWKVVHMHYSDAPPAKTGA